jgi:hypothetical protein
MAVSSNALIEAKTVVSQSLEQLVLAAYLFEAEPGEDGCPVRTDCATESGWQTANLSVAGPGLRAGTTDAGARSVLLGRWRERLSACKRP